ncbi:MAG: hypothetical protein U5R31_07565 [Acidimicrobiia bacterium]|nr:hypothetical protein [Acidimicrobiia bacterium]
MADLGLIPVNKVHPAARDGDARTHRHVPLGTWTHTVRARPCDHALVTVDGAVHETYLDDTGTLALETPRHRNRSAATHRRRHDRWRFSLGVTIPCPRGSFVAWISPHPQRGETGNTRPDQLRLIPPNDPHFDTLYGLRDDAEAINAEYKRTLVADRGPQHLGGAASSSTSSPGPCSTTPSPGTTTHPRRPQRPLDEPAHDGGVRNCRTSADCEVETSGHARGACCHGTPLHQTQRVSCQGRGPRSVDPHHSASTQGAGLSRSVRPRRCHQQWRCAPAAAVSASAS